MTIIIETPAPPTRERLVLVPVVGPGAPRDATPADLERAGWVPLAAFVGPLDLLSPPTLAGALQAIESIQNDADKWEDRADEARERAEKAEAVAAMTERERIRAVAEIRARAERAEREQVDALHERDEARADLRKHLSCPTHTGHSVPELCRAYEQTWVELEAAGIVRGAKTFRPDEGVRALREERDALRALVRFRSDGVNEPLDVELAGMFAQAKRDNETGPHSVSPLRVVFRAGAAHERAKPGHSLGCKCGRRSPATKDEDATVDAAQDAGWQVNGVDDYTEDLCPKCQPARLLGEVAR